MPRNTVVERSAEPKSTCGACGKTDDAPKHQILVGFNNVHTGGVMFHEHDKDRDGVIHYHFDCPTSWHDLHTNLATTPRESPDPDNWPEGEWLQEQADEHKATADLHAEIVAKAKSGVQNDELRSWIKRLHVKGGAGGVDTTMGTAILAALAINSATATVGTKTITAPIKMRVMTANGTDTSAGTEQATSGGYTAGGASISFAAAASLSVSSNAATSWTNFPASTTTGIEEWDSSATPQRTFWAPWSAGNIVVASGNTLTVASGSLTNTLA